MKIKIYLLIVENVETLRYFMIDADRYDGENDMRPFILNVKVQNGLARLDWRMIDVE